MKGSVRTPRTDGGRWGYRLDLGLDDRGRRRQQEVGGIRERESSGRRTLVPRTGRRDLGGGRGVGEMRSSRWTAVVVTVGLVVACAGEGEPAATPMPTTAATGTSMATAEEAASPTTLAPVSGGEALWGEEALAWIDALEAAAENGLEHLPPFIAPDLVWEDRIEQELIHGAANWFDARVERDLFGLFLPRDDAAYLVSADEVLRKQTIDYDPKPVSFLDLMEIGPNGLEQWTRSASVDAGRWYDHRRLDWDRYDALADRYLAVWNGSADVDVASVYDMDAVVADTLLGEEVSGQDAIGRSIASGAWPEIGLMSVLDDPDGVGRAVYIAPDDAEGMGPDGLWLLLDVDDGSGCPGRMGVTLELDGDLVRREHRFHDIESMRRCYEPAQLRPGWWDGLEIPEPVFRERTGTVTYADMTIEILNGAPELAAFVEWGLSRFDDAGLEVPHVASVTFMRAHAACYNLGGTAQRSEQGANITLCRSVDDICLDEACQTSAPRHRQLLLHELAHPWLDEHTNDAVRAEFLDLVGLTAWWDPSDAWRNRGVERAADAIAYGLMDDPVDIEPELATTCEERLAGFRVLTGADPMNRCDR
jgi:hypothetical protein